MIQVTAVAVAVPVRLPIHCGKLPLMLQFAMKRASRFTSVDKHLGSGSSLKLFPPVYSPNDSSLRLVSRLMVCGMDPLSWLPNNCSSSSPTRLPISRGMRPDRLQRQMHSRRKVTRLQSSFGMVPISPTIVYSIHHRVYSIVDDDDDDCSCYLTLYTTALDLFVS